jgi:hypothetical protein
MRTELRLEENKTYQIYNVEGEPIYWLHKVETFMWQKSYVVLLQIKGEHCYHTLRFRHHPTGNDVADLYIDRYLKKKFV